MSELSAKEKWQLVRRLWDSYVAVDASPASPERAWAFREATMGVCFDIMGEVVHPEKWLRENDPNRPAPITDERMTLGDVWAHPDLITHQKSGLVNGNADVRVEYLGKTWLVDSLVPIGNNVKVDMGNDNWLHVANEVMFHLELARRTSDDWEFARPYMKGEVKALVNLYDSEGIKPPSFNIADMRVTRDKVHEASRARDEREAWLKGSLQNWVEEEAKSAVTAMRGEEATELEPMKERFKGEYIDLTTRLAKLNPSEGIEGARFAIREAIASGGADLVPLVERFNIPRKELHKLIEDTGNFEVALDEILDRFSTVAKELPLHDVLQDSAFFQKYGNTYYEATRDKFALVKDASGRLAKIRRVERIHDPSDAVNVICESSETTLHIYADAEVIIGNEPTYWAAYPARVRVNTLREAIYKTAEFFIEVHPGVYTCYPHKDVMVEGPTGKEKVVDIDLNLYPDNKTASLVLGELHGKKHNASADLDIPVTIRQGY